jgi:hypothetical protein
MEPDRARVGKGHEANTHKQHPAHSPLLLLLFGYNNTRHWQLSGLLREHMTAAGTLTHRRAGGRTQGEEGEKGVLTAKTIPCAQLQHHARRPAGKCNAITHTRAGRRQQQGKGQKQRKQQSLTENCLREEMSDDR